jgi:hypothetical protein
MPIINKVKYPGDSIKKQRCAKKIVQCLGVSPKLPQYVKAKAKVMKVLNTIKVKRPVNEKLTDKQVAQKKKSAEYYQANKAALIKKHRAYNIKNKDKINIVRNELRANKKKKGLV